MGKGKKGGGKAVNRNMANLNNHRSVLKHNGLMYALTSAYRTYSYVNKDIALADNYEEYLYSGVNYPLVQSLLFLGSPVPSGFMAEFETHMSKSLTRLGLFSHIKPMASHSSYKPSMFAYVSESIASSFNTFYPDLHADAHSLYIKTLCILFEYERDFIEDKFLDISGNKHWFSMIYDRAISLCILNHIYKNVFRYIEDGKVGYDGILNSIKPVSAEAEEESVKRNISTLLSPNKQSIPGTFSSTLITEFNNSVLKDYMTAQINMCEKAQSVGSQVEFVCSKTNLIKLVPKTEINPVECYPFSFEQLNASNGFGAEFCPYMEIARMDLSGAENGDISILEGKDYYDRLLMSLDFIESMRKPEAILKYLCYLRMEYFYAFKENEYSDKCASLDKEIRGLKSDVKSEKREREKVEKELQGANGTILKYQSSDSVILKSNEVVVSEDTISKYESTISDLKSKVAELTNSLSKATGRCEWLDKQVKESEEKSKSYVDIDVENHELKAENRWLRTSLERLDAWNKEDVDTKQKRFEEQLSAVKDIPILFVGGIGDMMSKFKDYFPNSDYIDVSDEGTNFTVPPRFQYVVLYTRSITHPHCYRVGSQVPRERIIFMSMSNTELVVEELYKRIIEGGYSAE